MIKKSVKIMILLCAFCLTGCDITYNIEISDDKIIESSDFYLSESDYNSSEEYDEEEVIYENDVLESPSSFQDVFNNYYSQEYSAFEYDFDENSNYEKSNISNSNKYGINLKYNYDFENYKYSSMFNRIDCSYNIDDKYIELKVDDFSDYFYGEIQNINSLTINIKSNLKVKKHNADSVSGNVYTWNINSKNASKKKLEIKIRKKVNYFPIFRIVITVFIIFIIIGIFVLHIIQKNKISNTI